MTDRELMELAAKALRDPNIVFDGFRWIVRNKRGEADARGNAYNLEWNPLTDDGDALRLAVKLGMKVLCPVRQDGRDCASVTAHGINFQEQDDPDIATRRAIVRAAAAIGKNMGGTTAAAGACACIGPEKGQTLCPCDLRRKAAQ